MSVRRKLVSLSDLGSVGELVAAVATVATLVYLAMQIRQNSILIRNSTYQASNQWNLTALSVIAQDPETAATFNQGLLKWEDLTSKQRAQLAVLLALLFGGFAQQFESYRSGIISPEQWRRIEQLVAWYFSMPGIQSWWPTGKRVINPEFVDYVERVQAEMHSQ